MNSHPIGKGHLIGGILLIAGSCIGAGMLGVPVLSAQAGFIPSIAIFLFYWLFMALTGLLVLEVNQWYGGEANIITMADRTLGYSGKLISWGLFLFLFYSLMVAYVTASGSLVADFADSLFQISIPHSLGSLFFCCLFGILLYLGTKAVDWFNRILMFGLIVSYACLVMIGAPYVKTSLLQHQNWLAVTNVIPAVIISFGFHNLIPSLTTYFHSQVKPLKIAIILGSLIPLVVYLIWQWLILGIVPLDNFQVALSQGEIATEALKDAVGISWISSVAQFFAFFAIVTSFLSVALSFVDFLADGLKIKKTSWGKLFLILLVLLPPFICAMLFPHIFLIAINTAGSFGAVILFGILPVLMVWKGRYLHSESPPLVFGGKPILLAIFLISIMVIIFQIYNF